MAETQTTPVGVNRAADALIEALEKVDALAGFREGIRRNGETIALLGALSGMNAEAVQAARVWAAFVDLTTAVLDRRENGEEPDA